MPFSSDNILLDDSITGNTANFNFIRLSGTNISNIFYSTTNASPDNFVTGGTYSNGTLTLNRQNGSVSISGFNTGSSGTTVDTFVTGFTYNNINDTLTISQNQGRPILTVTGFTRLDIQGIGLSAATTTTSTSFIYLSGMTITTGNLGSNGEYLIDFTAEAFIPTNNATITFRLLRNGTVIPFTVRAVKMASATSMSSTVAISIVITNVTNGTTIRPQWRVSAGTGTINGRSLTIIGTAINNTI